MEHPFSLLIKYLKAQEWYRRLILFAWIFAVYIEFPLSLSGEKSIPSILLVVLLPFVWPFIIRVVNAKHFIFLFAITGIAVLSVIPHLSEFQLPSLVIRLLQYGYSVFMAVISLLLVVSLPEKDVRSVLFFLLWAMVVGIVLERIGILSPVTLAFRKFYEGTAYGGEINIFREEELAGFVRPIFFTTEPSLVGLGFIFISSSVALLSKSFRIDMILPFLQIIMFICLASPTILLSTLVWAIIMAVKYKMRFSSIFIALTILGTLIFLMTKIPVISDISEAVIDRFSNELLEEGTSIYARIYVPYAKTIPMVLSQFPLLGVGYSNHTGISALFGYPGELDAWESQFIIGANGTANFLNYLGIIGFSGTVLALIWLGRSMNVKNIGLLIMFWLALGQTIGTFSPPRYWCYTMLFLGCMIIIGKRIELVDENKID